VTVGIDIGGTSVRAAVIDSEGEIHASLRDATPHTERETEDILVTLISKLAGTQPVSAVGLAVAGFVSQDRRRVMFAPHLAWRDADVPERISARVQLPVVMDHDVNSAAWAEFARGASAGSQISLLIALGTGIGAGLIIDGEIYRGAHGVAPELGHLTVVPGGRKCACGKRGCWERYCSGTALAETARELMAGGDAPILRQLSGNDPATLTGTMVAIAATEGDPAALATPPPTTITSGSSTSVTSARPCASQRPSSSMAASAAGSPSVAAMATIVPVSASGSSPLSCRRIGASSPAISSRAVSANAVPEQ
jgi:glucokinase